MFWANPSTIAVLPTPGSPKSTGLFFVLRQRISDTSYISLSLPIILSNFPCFADSFKLVANFSRLGCFDSFTV